MSEEIVSTLVGAGTLLCFGIFAVNVWLYFRGNNIDIGIKWDAKQTGFDGLLAVFAALLGIWVSYCIWFTYTGVLESALLTGLGCALAVGGMGMALFWRDPKYGQAVEKMALYQFLQNQNKKSDKRVWIISTILVASVGYAIVDFVENNVGVQESSAMLTYYLASVISIVVFAKTLKCMYEISKNDKSVLEPEIKERGTPWEGSVDPEQRKYIKSYNECGPKRYDERRG